MKDLLGKEIRIGNMVISHNRHYAGIGISQVKKINKIMITLQPLKGFDFNAPTIVNPKHIAIIDIYQPVK